MNFDALYERIDKMLGKGDAWRTPPAAPGAPIEPILFGQSGGAPPRPAVWVARLNGVRVKYHTKSGSGEGCCACWSGDPPGSQPANDIGEFINFYGWVSTFDYRSWANYAAGMSMENNDTDQCGYDPAWIAAQAAGTPTTGDYYIGGMEPEGFFPVYRDASTYSPLMALNTADWGYDLKWSRKRWNSRSGASNMGSPGLIAGSYLGYVPMAIGYWRLNLPEFTRCSAEPRPARFVPYFHQYWFGIHVLI